MASRTSFLLAIAAALCSHGALAFECSLSAEGAAATVVRPTGESVRLGMLRGAEPQPDDYAEMLPQGTILWNTAGISIALPAQYEQSLRGLRIADAGGREVALEKTPHGYRIPPGNLQQGARYEWSVTADGKLLRGVFTLSTAARAAEAEQQAGAAGAVENAAPSTWRTVLGKASSLAAQRLLWDAGRVIRESL